MSGIVLTEEMKKRSLLSMGDDARLCRLFDKLRRGEEVTYAAIGGSITLGCNADVREHSYSYLLYEWLKNNFPNAKINYINAGIGATGSVIGVHRLHRDVLSKKPDFVTVEFSVNDPVDDEVKCAYDNLVHSTLNSEKLPAVLLISMVNKSGFSAQDLHQLIGDFYHLPIISYRNCVWPEIESGRLLWETFSNDNVHPNNEAHSLISTLITDYLNVVMNKKSNTEITVSPVNSYLTDDRYKNAQILYAGECEPKSLGCFERQPVSLCKMPFCWYADSNGEPLVFDLKNCRGISVAFERTNSTHGGKMTVDANGKTTVIDTDFPNGWGTCCNYSIAFESEVPQDVIVKITPLLETGKEIRVVAIMKY